MAKPKQVKPKCTLIGQDGNIFNLVACANKALRNADLAEQTVEMQNKVFEAVSYAEALQIIGEYVEIQ